MENAVEFKLISNIIRRICMHQEIYVVAASGSRKNFMSSKIDFSLESLAPAVFFSLCIGEV